MIRSVGCLITHLFCFIAPQVKENEQIKFIFEYCEKKEGKMSYEQIFYVCIKNQYDTL